MMITFSKIKKSFKIKFINSLLGKSLINNINLNIIFPKYQNNLNIYIHNSLKNFSNINIQVSFIFYFTFHLQIQI